MLRNIAYSSAIALGTASTAFAGGITEPVMTAPPVVVAPVAVVSSRDWTGFYVGASAGVGNVEVGTAPEVDLDTYGIHGGYMYDMGSVVVGGELEYSAIELDGGLDGTVLRLKGRVGYDAGAFLPYLTAGGAQLTLDGSPDVDDNGYFYGIGAEYAINDSFRVGGELLQHEFDDFNGGADISAQTMALRVSYSF